MVRSLARLSRLNWTTSPASFPSVTPTREDTDCDPALPDHLAPIARPRRLHVRRGREAQGRHAWGTPARRAYYLFRGDLANWVRQGDKKSATWPLEDGILTVKGGNIQTRALYRDFVLHVEFNVPYMPDKHGQARGNSGVYLDGIYELQVLDSYGRSSRATIARNLSADHPQRQCVQASTPVADLRRDLPRRAGKDGRTEKARLDGRSNGIRRSR